MSGLTAELDRLERALERLDTAMAAQAERSQSQIDEIADRVRSQAVTEIETELREDTATVAARVNQVIQRIETLLEK
jgi:nitrogen-specific signal transduction histidine kinase